MIEMNESNRSFVFPDSLHDLTVTRLGIDTAKAESFRRQLDVLPYLGRISDIDIRCKDNIWTMRFSLDDRRSGKCFIEKEHMDWIDAGLLTVFDLAVHFSRCIRPGFARKPVQRTLFD